VRRWTGSPSSGTSGNDRRSGNLLDLALIFFRSQSFSQAWVTCKSWVLFDSPGSEPLALSWLGLAAILLLVHWLNYRRFFAQWWRQGPDWAFACGLGLAVALIITLVPTTTQPFIYFQF